MAEHLTEMLKYLIGSGGLLLAGKGIAILFKWIKDMANKDGSKATSSNNININVDQGDQHILTDTRWQQTLYLLLQQAKILRAIHLLPGEILKEQMESFKKTVIPIRIRYSEVICELMADAGIDNVHFGTYFSNAENFIELCMEHVKSTFRQMCKENHFSKKSTNEFRDLVETNIFIIDGLMNEMMMKRYPQRQLLRNGEKFDLVREELRDALEDCFKKCRDIAIEKTEKVEEARCEFEIEIYRVTGNRYSFDI